MATDRDKLIAKIRALQAKTTANGCTEAEAMAAAAKMTQLMAAYDLTFDTIELGETRCAWKKAPAPDYSHPIMDCLMAVSFLTDTVVWREQDAVRERPSTVDLFGDYTPGTMRTVASYTFFGLPQDVEVAHYLTAICHSAMNRAAAGFYAEQKNQRRAASPYRPKRKAPDVDQLVRDFQVGMAASMSRTLRDMKPKNQRSASGRDIVASKTAIVKKGLQELGIQLKKSQSSRRYDHDALHAGAAAGEDVRFNPGVRGGAGATLAIGGR